jgi:hypothetical protein
LSHIERDILSVWCVYCVISQGIIMVVTILSLVNLTVERLRLSRASAKTV